MEKNSEIPEFIADLFSRELSVEDKEKVQLWMNESEDNQKTFAEFQDIWQAASLSSDNDYNPENAWNKFHHTLNVSKPKRSLSWLKYAAVAIIFSSLSVLAYYLLSPVHQQKVTFQEVYVPYGSTSKIVLPDGSYVWLNAGSYLQYNNSFNITNRDIYLKGEAYFDVNKNKKLKFIVNTPGIKVMAIGTKFNVKAYPEEKTILTTVVEGKVQVISEKEDQKKGSVFVTANQTVSLIKEYAAAPVTEPELAGKKQISAAVVEEIPSKIVDIKSEVNPDIYVSWHEGKLIIERETLGSLATKLERRYNVKIKFLNEDVRNYIFSGVLKDETFEQVLEIIRLTSPLKYSIQGNVVHLTEDNSLKNRLY
jgi:ferric-dicitrate binding protein FerR (iron transport regulator)